MSRSFSSKFLFIIFLIVFTKQLSAQMAGTYTVPGSFSSIAAAVNSLNTVGISAGVTVYVQAGYTETVPVGGLTLTASGSAATPIVFAKNGTGTNPLLTAYTGGVGTPSTAVQDGIWRFIGSDYITINGIDLVDPNTANPATMEFGYGLFKASTTNGCRNNTIINCVITLNRINNAPGVGPAFNGSRGIELVNALVNSHTVAVTVAAGAGANSNNQIFANTIQNCNIGVALSGATVAASSANIDAANDVGGTLTGTGNTILNFGTGTYSSYTNIAYGIYSVNQQSLNVGFNAINTNTPSGVSLYGIYYSATYNSVIANNSITINGAYMSAIYLDGATGGSVTGVINNRILNCSSSTGTSGFDGIYSAASPSNLTVSGNLVSGLTFTAGSGFIHGIDITIGNSAQCTLAVNSNTVTNMTNLITNASIYGIHVSGSNQTSFTVQSNYVNNVSRASTVTTGILYGLMNESASSNWSPNAGYVLTNTVSNLSNGATNNNQETYGIFFSSYIWTGLFANGNLINNIIGGTADTHGIYMNEGNATSSASSNTVTNLNSSGKLYGIKYNLNSYNAPTNVNGNTVGGLLCTGASSVFGIYAYGINYSLRKNKIYDIAANGAGSAYVFGIYTMNEKCDLNNNMVGDLRAPNSDYTNAINGILLWGISNNPDHKVFYNTIRIGAVTSTGLYFGSIAFNHMAGGTPTLTLRNNIFINLSTPTGGSSAIAFKRDVASLTSYSSTSNKNIFYAGTPSANNLIYTDGTNNVQTLSAFQTLVTPREANSLTENTPFLSTTGTSGSFLHVSPPSLAESNAANITGIVDDFDGNIRQGNTGYVGNGTAPDIGADEFDTPLCSAVNASTISPASFSVCAGQSVALTLSSSQVAVVPGIQMQWQRSFSPGGPYTLVAVASATSTTYFTPTLTAGNYYYTFANTCSVSSQTAVSNEVTVSVYAYPQPTLTPAAPVICSGSSPSVAITASGANQFSWSPSGSLSSSSGSMVIANPASNSTYVVTGINPGGCTGSSTIIVSVYASPTIAITGNSLICSGQTASLAVNGASTYSWNTGATNASIYPTPATNTSYTVTGFLNPGNCTAQAAFNVSVMPAPTISIAGTNTFCAGQSATLTASGGSVYLWNTGATTNSIPITPLNNTVFVVTSTNSANGCTVNASYPVSVYQIPVVSIAASSPSVCAGNTATLTASGAFFYNWVTLGNNSAIVTVTPGVTTTYTVSGSIPAGCSADKTISIGVFPAPSILVTPAQQTICLGESATFTASGGNTYVWNPTGSPGNTLTVSPLVSETYTVTGFDNNNCSDKKTVSLTVDECSGVAENSLFKYTSVFPNPSSGVIHAVFTKEGNRQLNLFNCTGELIEVRNSDAVQETFDLSEKAKGIYFLNIVEGKSKVGIRIVLE